MGEIAAAAVGLSAQQRDMAARIEAAFLAAGYAREVAAAAIVNAYAESRLDPRAVGDRGRAVGLFQLHDKGAGAGLSVAQRQDPGTNIATLLQRERAALSKLVAEHAAGASPAKLVARFSTLVERPSLPAVREAERVAMLLRLYPMGLPSTLRAAPTAVAVTQGGAASLVRWGLLGASAALLGLGLVRWLNPPPRAR